MRKNYTDPWRDVHEPRLRHGRSGLGSQTYSRRWWDLRLDCGHLVERTARAKPGAAGGRSGFALMNHPVSDDELLPPPKRVRCEDCGAEARRG